MVFKKMLRALGVGGPSVDTVLSNPACRPGGQLEGVVHMRADDHPVDIDYVTLGLITRIESESGDSEYSSTMEFHRLQVAGAFHLQAGQVHQIPFRFPVPWETPITAVYNQPLHGMTMGLRTELAVAKAVDKGDLDAVQVHPLPAQDLILQAMERLGFRFKHADLERGQLYGVHQTLPFFQEIEFYPPHYVSGINEVEVTFVANPQSMEVILEFDKRGGIFTSGHDAYARLHLDYATMNQTDWAAQIDAWIRGASSQYGSHSGYGQPHGMFGGHHGGHGHGYHRGHRGGGLGMAGGVAGGFLGGMVAGEVMDDMFGDD